MDELLSSTASAGAGSAGAAQNSSAASLAENFEMFLTLLTEQLQNQDPLSPLDSNEFVGQLVDFSSVEQQIQQTELMEEMAKLQATENVGVAANMAVGFLGNEVTINGGEAALVDGQARWTYTLDQQADAIEIKVLDASGSVVATPEANHAAGSHDIVWDGLSDTGAQLEDGVYTLEVSATSQDAELHTPIVSYGVATGVDLSEAEPIIEVDTLSTPLSRVTGVAA